jgi:hypothetical protein
MRLSLLFLFSFLFAQCQQNCKPFQEQLILVKFLNYNTKKELGDSILFFKVQGTGSNFHLFRDTIRANTQFPLILSPNTDNITYTFTRSQNKTYTLDLQYQRELSMGNPDCGFVVSYSNLQAKGQSIDSIAVISSTILENATSPNLVFYIKP